MILSRIVIFGGSFSNDVSQFILLTPLDLLSKWSWFTVISVTYIELAIIQQNRHSDQSPPEEKTESETVVKEHLFQVEWCLFCFYFWRRKAPHSVYAFVANEKKLKFKYKTYRLKLRNSWRHHELTLWQQFFFAAYVLNFFPVHKQFTQITAAVTRVNCWRFVINAIFCIWGISAGFFKLSNFMSQDFYLSISKLQVVGWYKLKFYFN